jgi:hypothetical protein
MSRVFASTVLAVSCWVAGVSLASAATVSPQSGEVLANSGTGFTLVSATTELKAGGQLLVRPGGSAVIQYENGCSLRVGSDRVWVIQDKPPCEPGRALDLTARMNGGSLKDSPEAPAAFPWLVVPVIGGGIVACVIYCGGDDDKPASP